VAIASPPTRPSPNGRRVGIRIVTFEACSGFTHVTAHRIAQPPQAAFVTRLRPSGCPAEPLASDRINRQLSGWNPPPLVIRAFGAHCQEPTFSAFLAPRLACWLGWTAARYAAVAEQRWHPRERYPSGSAVRGSRPGLPAAAPWQRVRVPGTNVERDCPSGRSRRTAPMRAACAGRRNPHRDGTIPTFRPATSATCGCRSCPHGDEADGRGLSSFSSTVS
jgi:hypothetical protein